MYTKFINAVNAVVSAFKRLFGIGESRDIDHVSTKTAIDDMAQIIYGNGIYLMLTDSIILKSGNGRDWEQSGLQALKDEKFLFIGVTGDKFVVLSERKGWDYFISYSDFESTDPNSPLSTFRWVNEFLEPRQIIWFSNKKSAEAAKAILDEGPWSCTVTHSREAGVFAKGWDCTCYRK